ncbi:TPM domain-containing protein [bacterium]|nr:TPM domain-containing protein [bacterium]
MTNWRGRFLCGILLCLLIALVVPAVHAKAELPAFKGYVNDYVGLLDANHEKYLTNLLGELDKKTGAQVAVAIIKSTAPLDLETYSVDLAQKWGIGKKGKDNGVLVLVARDDRRMRIEVGYGLEPKFTDGQSGRIIRSAFTPYFKQNRYSEGILIGTTAVAQHIASIYGVTLSGASTGVKKPTTRHRAACGGLLLPLLFILFFGRRGFLGMLLFGSLLGRRGGFWSGGGSGGSGGGFGGGFGGFGGGSFGGGGASGSW